MKETTTKQEGFIEENDRQISERLGRRNFLKIAGAGAVGIAAFGLVGCQKDDHGPDMSGNGLYFGSGDIAILNYAYALEQLEAAFYIEVMNKPYSGISDWETMLFSDIRDHEIAHREFFKTALGKSAIANLEFNFSGINFSNRANVLATAKAFEDLGVSAYNGAGWLIKNEAYLVLAGKIVSVEARHAALVRDLIDTGTFANNEVIDNQGLDLAYSPTKVLEIAAPFIKSKIDVRDLPTY